MSLDQANTRSTLHTGTTTFAANDRRGYLFVVILTGTATIKFGGGDGEIPLPTIGSWYEPLKVPTSEFTITCGDAADTFVVHADDL